MPGRPALPEEIKSLTGTQRKHRINKERPQYDILIAADPPDHLSKNGKMIWADIVPQLMSIGLVTSVDVWPLSIMCYELGEYYSLSAAVTNKKFTIKGNKLEANFHALKLAKTAAEHFKNAVKIMQEYGITPASRQKLKVKKPDKPVKDIMDI